MDKREGITIFRRKVYVSQCRQNFVREPYCFSESFWFRKSIMDENVVSGFYIEKFSVSQCRKISLGKPLVCH